MRPRREIADDRPVLEAIAYSTVQERIYDRLRDGLLTGRLVPGQKIVIRDLAATLGTSMMPVREALRRLEAEHALVTDSGRTLCVPSLSIDDCQELSMLRVALEGTVAQEAAQRITARELARVGDALAAWEDAVRDADVHRALLHNRDFHWSIYAASRRPLALKLIEALWLRLGPQLALSIGRGGGAGLAALAECHPHRELFAALGRHEGPAVRAAIIRDIRASEKIVAARLRRQAATHGRPGKFDVSDNRKEAL
jgi:DNA-binding GntR family transcriptional regulator